MEVHEFAENGGSSKHVRTHKMKKRRSLLLYGFLIVALLAIIIGLAVGIPLSGSDSSDPHMRTAHEIMRKYPLIDG